MATAKKASTTSDDLRAEELDKNVVHIVGRLGAAAAAKELPSGDVVVSFRVVMRRTRRTRARSTGDAPGIGAQVDTIDCAAWRADVRKAVSGWEPGDVVEVEGALRRRFWRDPARGATSRVEVEVARAKRLRRAE